jgi:superfamily II DNA helicase RecQ
MRYWDRIILKETRRNATMRRRGGDGTRAEMAHVPGVGEAKLDRYGPAFVAVIAEHA